MPALTVVCCDSGWTLNKSRALESIFDWAQTLAAKGFLEAENGLSWIANRRAHGYKSCSSWLAL